MSRDGRIFTTFAMLVACGTPNNTGADAQTSVDASSNLDVQPSTDTLTTTDTLDAVAPPDDSATRPDEGVPSDAGTAAQWTFRTSQHGCVGNRTDVLYFDGDTHGWIGCGSTTQGFGLYESTDRGVTWSSVSVGAPNLFSRFRVTAIHRSANGRLWVGGINTNNAQRVVSLDTTGSTYTSRDEFVAGNQLWNNFQAGSATRASTGFAIAESLTGTALAFRTGDDQPWQDGSGYLGGSDEQLLDVTLFNNQFYAVGSRISQPPFVYLPPRSATTRPSFVPLRMSTAFAGELWGIDVDTNGIIAGGVDQDNAIGMVYFTNNLADPYSLSNWRSLSATNLAPNGASWIRGVCRSGRTLVAVGEYSRSGTGIALASIDMGTTWRNITSRVDPAAPALSRCRVLPDGSVAIAGAGGFFARGMYQ